MPEAIDPPHSGVLTRAMLPDFHIPGTGTAFAGPQLILHYHSVVALRNVAEEMRENGEFSRELPSRVRSVQHLSSTVNDVLKSARFEEMMSNWAGTRLVIHPSAHFGCSFNWTRLCPLGLTDAWHLDAAPYTAVILLSEPGSQYDGGELCLFTKDPLELWESLRTGNAPTETATYLVPFTQAGEVFLFQGRTIPHCVRPIFAGSTPNLTGIREGRLTLAIGLYSPVNAQHWLFPGLEPDERIVADSWRIEAKKACLLATIERIRRTVAWPHNPNELSRHEGIIDDLLAKLLVPPIGT